MIMFAPAPAGERLVNLGIQQLARRVPGATLFVFAPFGCSATTRVKLMAIFVVDFGFVRRSSPVQSKQHAPTLTGCQRLRSLASFPVGDPPSVPALPNT